MIRLRSVLMAAVLVVVGCGVASDPFGFPPQEFVEGIPIGERATCQDGCRQFLAYAGRWLDAVEPGHVEIVNGVAYQTDYRNEQGERVLTTRSGGGDLIVVLDLADGSRRAVHVGCGVGVATDLCFASSGPPDFESRGPLLSVPDR